MKKIDLYSVYKPDDICVRSAFASRKEAKAMIDYYGLVVGQYYNIERLIIRYSFSTADTICRVSAINIIKEKVLWEMGGYSDRYIVKIEIDRYINHGVMIDEKITKDLSKEMSITKKRPPCNEKEILMETIGVLTKQLESVIDEFSKFKIKVGEEISNMRNEAWRDLKRSEIKNEMKIMEGNNTHRFWSSIDIECIEGSVPFGVYKKSSRYADLEKQLRNL